MWVDGWVDGRLGPSSYETHVQQVHSHTTEPKHLRAAVAYAIADRGKNASGTIHDNDGT